MTEVEASPLGTSVFRVSPGLLAQRLGEPGPGVLGGGVCTRLLRTERSLLLANLSIRQHVPESFIYGNVSAALSHASPASVTWEMPGAGGREPGLHSNSVAVGLVLGEAAAWVLAHVNGRVCWCGAVRSSLCFGDEALGAAAGKRLRPFGQRPGEGVEQRVREV